MTFPARAAVVTTLLFAALVTAAPGTAPVPAATPAVTPPVGPMAGLRSAGATPSDDDELQAWLAAPAGPAVIHLAPRVHRGPLVIRRPLTLTGAEGAIIDGGGTGSVVDVNAEGVTLENLVVRGSGRRNTTEDVGIRVRGKNNTVRHVRVEDSLFGISLEACASCEVSDSLVQGTPGAHGAAQGDGIKVWESHDSQVARNVVRHMRDVVVWYSRRVTLDGNTIRDCRYGTHFMYAHDSVVRNSTLVDNTVGIFVMYSARLVADGNVIAGGRGSAGVGLGFKESDGVQVRNNRIIGNTTGTYLDRTPRSTDQPVVFEGNVLALNDVAMRYHSAQKGVTHVGNDFLGNGIVVEVDGGGDVLGVDFRGNHWSDYAGFDLDGDAQGDVAFEVKKLSGELTDAHPAMRLFQGSAAMALVDAVARAVPFLSRRQMLVDPEPRMRPLGRM